MSDDLRHDRHDERLNRLEDQFLDLGDSISEISRLGASQDATLHIMASQLGTLTNQPSKMPVIVSIFSVGIAFLALALTPIAWLAVNNSQKLDERAALIGATVALIQRSEAELAAVDERVRHLERMRMFAK